LEGGREIHVVYHRVETDVHERPRSDSPASGDVRDAVDVIRLPYGSRLHLLVVDAIDERRDDAAEPRLVALRGDQALKLVQPLEPLELQGLRNVVVHLRGARPFLRRIRERADPIELDLLEELEEHREVCFGFSREADDARRPNRHVGYRVANARDTIANNVLPLRATHTGEHGIRTVLNRHIQIRHDPALGRHQFQQARREPG
jgi:hypothetical protein